MAIAISAILFAFLVGAITYFGYRKYARPARVYEQLGGAAALQMPAVHKLSEDDPGLAVTVIQQVGEKVPVSPEDLMVTRRDLIAAGYRSETAVAVFYGIKVLLTVTLIVLALLFRDYITANFVLRLVIVVAAGALGWVGPGFYLEHLIANRHEELRFALPDALDLMTVSVEAGLALDQAIQYVAREIAITHPALGEELGLVTLEMRAGKRRAEALRNLADRTGEPELRKLVAIMVQTDRFGTSIADSLRTHSDFMRVRRRQQAEERANKVGVKLVFPIFFFILPAMLLVSAGPGLLQVFKYLFPMMRQFDA